MKFKRWFTAVGVCFLGGCSSADQKSPSSLASNAAGGADPDASQNCDYVMPQIALGSDLVVPSGKTVCVGPGVTFTATANITVQVQGTLVVAGTPSSPVRFAGSGTPSSWHGIVVAAGGKLQMAHATVRDAQYAIHAMPGSSYGVDHADLGASFKTAVLESDGTFDHTYFRATAPATVSVASDVAIDDPNGSMTILSASPSVSNSEFDGASPFTDLIRIGGNSSPVFDHVHLKNAHCGFHTYGGTNNAPRVTNSIIEGLSYGVMAYTTKPGFSTCIFRGNATDVGLCDGATATNAPTLAGNYYAAGSVKLDTGCAQIGTSDSHSATAAVPAAGPVGL